MKSMPYALKQKIRQYDKTNRKARLLHDEIEEELIKYGVPYANVTALTKTMDEETCTEALAFINNCEGEIEENIAEIEEVFLYFVNKN